jgi:iron complex transport system substrate-binding protein
MKEKQYRNFFAGLVLLFLTICLCACDSTADTAAVNRTSSSYEVTDDKGSIVTMTAKPQRILTLSMSTDEIMLGLVPPEKMVGINSILDDPVSSNIVALAEKIPVKISNPSVEEIAALRPDLVIIPDWGDLEKAASLRELGIKVVVCKGAKSIEEIKETIRLLAQAVGEEDRGKSLVAKMDEKMAEIKKKVDVIPQNQRKKVVLISLMQSYGGSGCTFDDACRYAGVTNGIAAAGIKSGQTMSKEQLVKINPDVLFLPTYNNHGRYDVDTLTKEYLEDPSLQTLTAIKEKHLRKPREGYIYNGSQDVVFGIQEIAYAVYGEAFSQPDDYHISAVE